MMLNKTFHLLLLSLIPLLGFSQANSQYPDSGNKIRLGFQTTGDGLIWRDTQPNVGVYQPINNKAAWIVLDTVNNKFYHYKNSAWTLAGGQDIDTANLIATKYNLGFKLSLADTQNMLSPYWRSDRFSGTLPVANGGTGQTTPTAALNALLQTQSQSTTIGATLKSNGTNSYWDNFSAAGTVQDQSGNFYNTVAIGTQVWFKENLRTKKYRSGALIPIKTNTDTSTLVGQMYYYNNDSLTNYSVYGALYNWRATQNSDSLCPVGWHVPTDAEWTTLTTYLGGESVAGGKMKATGTTYWNSPNTGVTNESGFSALPGGYRSNDGSFTIISSFAFFWSATENGSSLAWIRYLGSNFGSVIRSSNISLSDKSVGASVRCLRNTPANNLSSDFTGTLAVANGGTNTSTAFTAGSVVFAGSGGTYTQDNSNLFFDDTNNRVGIGLTNPEAKIHIKSDVNGTSNMIFENLQGGPNSSAAIYLKTRNLAGTADVTGIITKTKTGGYYFDNNENSTNAFMQFSNYLTTWMYADGNGRVGIGTVLPTARLHVKGSGVTSSTSALKVDNNGNTNLLNILDNGTATFRNISNSGAPSTSGTTVNATLSIDNAFSVMTNIGNLSNSPYSVWLQVQDKGNLATTYPLSLQPNGGNVGIGTASPAGTLDIRRSAAVTTISVANSHLAIGVGGETYGVGRRAIISLGYGVTQAPAYIGYIATVAGNYGKGDLVFGIRNDDATEQIPIERMRITSDGNVCVATTTASYSAANRGNLTIGGLSSSLFAFQTNSIDRSYLYHEGTNFSLVNNSSGGSVYVSSNGGGVVLSSGATSWASSSDERLKNINYNIENVVSKLSSLRTVNFSWKSDQTKKEFLGLIAQDVEKVFPQVISKNNLPSNIDDVQIDKTEYLSVRYTELIPVLVKAVQELSAEIDILKQEIINLKNK